ncbi:Zinc finger C2H2-type protein [Neofusicoccum parvum]|uniref:Zinc finger C2H2-type protein n=1 Tax=Neofusicoccum parvum TaxID=310453 RepID=A0ACB5RNL9_9PEZI|nr:Zinc finger C2H2-type protein [Neofusicoccum parvum]
MSGKQRRVYKCSTCARVFKRSEHCSRHERIHTRERPFACQYCHKKYARKDLVTRHEKTLHSEKRRQSIATAVPESPGSRGSSETSETINVSVPSNPSSQPDVSQLFEAEQEIQPIVTLAENHASIAASAELSPHQLAVADERRNSQILIPADVATPSFGFGNTVETLYPSPQSCPEQAQVNFQPWGEQIVALQEVPMQGAYMPIDPQLCEPQPPLDFDITGHRGSQGSQAAVPSIESRNDSMDAAQDSMGPPTKRRRLTSNGSQTVDTQRPSRQDWQNDLESTSIDIFRDFWSPPEPPSDMAQDSMESLEFPIPIDPFLMGGQDLSSQQQNGSLFSTNFAFGNQSIDLGSSNWQSFLEGASQASQEKKPDPPKLAHALSYGRIEDFRHPYSSDAQSSLIFNTNALIRIANTRLFGNADSFNRFILTSDNKHEISTAMGSYLSAPQARNAFTTKGAAQAYEGFTLPAKVGPMLVRKTAAFGWSIEHAVAWWDTSLFLTKWVHTLQVQEKTQPPDDEEKKILEQVKTVLGEMEHEYDGEGSLAAAVARACATYLSDTWVWGVTPRMGSVLTKLADAYEKNLQEENARS